MRELQRHGLMLPARPLRGPAPQEVVWVAADSARVLHILHNPAYAGAVRPELPDAPSHLGTGGVRPDKERSASQREDPIHLGAATRQCEGAIRRAKRRGQWAEAWEPRSGSALAETGRLSASECPSKVRNVEQAQEAGGLDQKVSG